MDDRWRDRGVGGTGGEALYALFLLAALVALAVNAWCAAAGALALEESGCRGG